MKNRFDLESEINNLYNFSEQLGTLSEGILENNLDQDEVISVIEGLRIILNLQAQKLYDTMCQCFQLDEYQHFSDTEYDLENE